MKIKLTFLTLICLIVISCEKNNDDNKFDIGKGFELYLTITPYSHNLYKDYGTINFDTILLSDKPFLRYNDLIKHDTLTHKLTLGISHVQRPKIGQKNW